MQVNRDRISISNLFESCLAVVSKECRRCPLWVFSFPTAQKQVFMFPVYVILIIGVIKESCFLKSIEFVFLTYPMETYGYYSLWWKGIKYELAIILSFLTRHKLKGDCIGIYNLLVRRQTIFSRSDPPTLTAKGALDVIEMQLDTMCSYPRVPVLHELL